MDVLTKEERHRNMSAIKSRDTKPEIYFRKQLFSRGYRYRICPKGISGHPDIWLPKYRTAIFINGCFWHAHEGCRYFRIPESNREFWEDKFRKNMERDKRVISELKEQNIRVVIVWECAIRKMHSDSNFNRIVIDQICRFLEETVSPFIEFEWPVRL